MSTKAPEHHAAAASKQVTVTGFPTNQNVLMPNPGSGDASLYLAGTGQTLYLYFASNGDAQVRYGQNYSAPTTPLPAGISMFPNGNGFNLAWTSTTGNFKLVWGTS